MNTANIITSYMNKCLTDIYNTFCGRQKNKILNIYIYIKQFR